MEDGWTEWTYLDLPQKQWFSAEAVTVLCDGSDRLDIWVVGLGDLCHRSWQAGAHFGWLQLAQNQLSSIAPVVVYRGNSIDLTAARRVPWMEATSAAD